MLRDLLDSLHGQGFRRFLLVNGHGGNIAGGSLVREWAAVHPDAQAIFHSWWSSERVVAAAREIDPEPSHANWFENFPWTRLDGVELPPSASRRSTEAAYRVASPEGVRELLGDGVFAGAYELPDEQVVAVWRTGRRGGPRAARERMAVDPLAVFHEWFEEARARASRRPR